MNFMRAEELVGQAILPVAAFQAALSGKFRGLRPGGGRLNALPKGDPGQDCVPHAGSRL
jgi:hypothetical protein